MTLNSAAPSPTITLFLDLPFDGGNLFTIGDPILGLLDFGGELAGDIGTDISADGFQIDITRGRASTLDPTDVGTATVMLRNFERDWDPLNTSSPYAGTIEPGRQVNIEIYAQRIFTGYTDDWLNTYTVAGDAVATFPCIDGLGVLGRQQFDAWTTTASQLAGARLTAVLNRNEVAWPGGARDIGTGLTAMQGDAITWGSNVLNYIQLVTASERGNAFVDRDGVFVFRDRENLSDPTATPTLTFADDGSGYPFSAATLTSAGQNFYSQVSVDREGGTVQTATDAGVGAASAIRRLSLDGLLMNSDTAAMGVAQWVLTQVADPVPHVDTITVNMAALNTDKERATVCDLDLADLVHVTWTPMSTGSTISDDYTIEAINHSIPYNGPHLVTFGLSPAYESYVFTIEDNVLGKLNGIGRLAF